MTIELTACKNAEAIAEEVFSSIRTVFSYNGQGKEIQRFADIIQHRMPLWIPFRYEQHVDSARKSSVRRDIFNGVVFSICTCLIWNIVAFGICTCSSYNVDFLLDTIGFWYGNKRIHEGGATLANICTVNIVSKERKMVSFLLLDFCNTFNLHIFY